MEKIQTIAENIGKNCCLAYAYLWAAGVPVDCVEYFKICYFAIKAGEKVGGLDNECFVADAEKFLFFATGRRYRVTKKVVASLSGIKSRTPVQFSAPGYIPHFVGVENGKIQFDGYLNSKSVEKGKPISARIVEEIKSK